MNRRTVYIIMGGIVALCVAFFAVVSIFHLESKIIKPALAGVKPGGPKAFSVALYGDFNKPLKKPMDVAKVDNYTYVTDASSQNVQVFDDSGSAAFQFGKAGTKEGEFSFPYGISGDENGHIYVADMNNGNISIFTSKGKFVKYFDDKDKVLKAPGGLRIINQKLYVTDIKVNKVFVFDLNGKKLMEIGGPGDATGKFIAPNAVTVDFDNNIYVSDSANNRVEIFDKNGKYIKLINGSKDGKGNPTFLNPRGVGIDSSGNLYVVNNLSHTVYAFDKNGKELYELGGMGTENDKFYLPNGLFVDDSDHLYVTDTVNQRVSIFK